MTQSTERPNRTRSAESLARIFAAAVGAVLLTVGILGFIPGITTHYGSMTFVGHASMAKLFGVFEVSVLHNLVHLLFGAAGLVFARQVRTAYGYLIIGGAIYLLLWAYGLAVDHNSGANFVPVNNADNWLHLGLGLTMIALGVVGTLADRWVPPPRTSSEDRR